MAVLKVNDECLAPENEVHLYYQGPDPWEVVEKISDNIRAFFHVSASGQNHERLNWDITEDPITYWSRWWVRKKMSRMTDALIYIWVQGTKYKTDNTGRFHLRMHAEVRTTVEGPWIILKPFWVTYSYLFYDRVRRRFIERCRDLTMNFRNWIKEEYGLQFTTIPQAHTVFGNR